MAESIKIKPVMLHIGGSQREIEWDEALAMFDGHENSAIPISAQGINFPIKWPLTLAGFLTKIILARRKFKKIIREIRITMPNQKIRIIQNA